MAGSVRLLIPLAACILAAPAFTEDNAPGARMPGKQRGDDAPSPEFQNVRRALDALTPEQRKRFQENLVRWANLPPDEKKALREREEMRRKFIQQEIDAALKDAGLDLKGERREQFVKRYGEERRKIEEQLRKEASEKRKPLVHELLGRLKTEFATP